MSKSSLPRHILGHALLLGIAGDALLRTPRGLGIPLWAGLLALAAASLTRAAGRVVTVQTAAWLLTAVGFSVLVAWRESETLQVLDAGVAIGAFGMAALTLSDARTALFAPRLRDTLWAGAELFGRVAIGVVPFAAQAVPPEGRGVRAALIRPVLRAAFLSLVLLLVFGSLLRADPLFASLVRLPRIDFEAGFSHGFAIGFFTWIVGGWAGGALVARTVRLRAPDALPLSFGLLDVTVALGTLTLLFAAFVATQLGWYFGGEQFLRERTGLTAAEYARQGFFQMVWVVFLVVGVLLASRAALRPGRAVVVRHTLLSLPLVALLGAIIVSAATRMRLYVHYYGLTDDRLYTLVFMGWLAVVVVWLTVTVLRGWGRPFVAGAVLSGLATLLALNLAAPDVLIARVNIARASGVPDGARPPLDLAHLARLSGEAAELVAGTVISGVGDAAAGRCEAARLLLERWGPYSPPALRVRMAASWRWWNFGEAKAVRVVSGRAAELATVRRRHCSAGPVTALGPPPASAASSGPPASPPD